MFTSIDRDKIVSTWTMIWSYPRLIEWRFCNTIVVKYFLKEHYYDLLTLIWFWGTKNLRMISLKKYFIKVLESWIFPHFSNWFFYLSKSIQSKQLIFLVQKELAKRESCYNYAGPSVISVSRSVQLKPLFWFRSNTETPNPNWPILSADTEGKI